MYAHVVRLAYVWVAQHVSCLAFRPQSLYLTAWWVGLTMVISPLHTALVTVSRNDDNKLYSLVYNTSGMA